MGLLEQIRDPDAALLKRVFLSPKKTEITLGEIYEEKLKLIQLRNNNKSNMNSARPEITVSNNGMQTAAVNPYNEPA